MFAQFAERSSYTHLMKQISITGVILAAKGVKKKKKRKITKSGSKAQ
jgi:hypothetical protein